MRQACDRCHAKKTKCPKHPGASSCIRCAKAGAACTFSPTTTRSSFRPYEPPVGAPMFSPIDPQSTRWEHRWQQNGNGPHENMMPGPAPPPDPFQPWPNPSELPVDPSLNLADNSHQEIPMDPNLGAAPVDPSLSVDTQLVDPSLNAAEEEPDTQQQNGQEDPSFQVMPDVEKLMDVTMALDSMLRSYPSKKINQTSMEDAQQWISKVSAVVDLKTRLEKILEYATHIDELYPAITRLATPQAEENNLNEGSSQDANSMPFVDYALLNVLVACHTKLLDMLDLLIGHGKMCSHIFTQLPKDQERTYDIPEVRIGKVAPSKDRAASYYIMFTADFLDSLSGRTKELESVVSSPDEKRERESKILNLQCEILKDRAEGLMKGLVDLNEALTKQGLIH